MINLFGYIDPASTALIWQILAGVFITMGVVLGIWWTKITTFLRTVWVKIFGGKRKESASKAEAEASEEVEEKTTPEESKEVSEKIIPEAKA